MAAEYVMGLDIGSGTVEAIIVDKEGTIVGSSSTHLEPYFSRQTGYIEQHPQDWEKKVYSAIKQALEGMKE